MLDGSGQLPARPKAPRRADLILKRLLDVVLSLVALVAIGPIMVLVALAVALTSRGPIIFRQLRPGRGGLLFPMYKFRTMRLELGDSSGVRQTIANDPRLTPIGAFLRRKSLDELPQLFNVLLGHMSLVGPRPHPAGILAGGMDYRALVPFYDMRHAMRPGMSGWAQCNGLRGPTVEPVTAASRIAHDVAYIQHFSVLLDLRIIAMTLRREFTAGTGS